MKVLMLMDTLWLFIYYVFLAATDNYLSLKSFSTTTHILALVL